MEIIKKCICALMVSVTKAFRLVKKVENISLSICVEYILAKSFRSVVFLQSSEYQRRLHRYIHIFAVSLRERR